MKTILIVVSKDIIRRNILDTGFWRTFCSEAGQARIVLLVDEGREDEYRKKFGATHVEVVDYKRTPYSGWQKILMFFIRTGLYSKSTTFHRRHTYVKGRAGFFITLYKGLLAQTLGRMGWYKRFLRTLLLLSNGPQGAREIFDTHKPDLVFTPSLIDIDVDVPVALEAKRRGIRLVGMVRSWDNLNHHFVMPVVPDYFLFQNKWLKHAAETFQAINLKQIESDIVGLPHYDIYFDPSPYIKERDEFLKSIGLDPNKKFIFLGGSEYYYSEDSLLKLLNDKVGDGSIDGPAQILYRMHPSSIFSVGDMHLDRLAHVVLDGAFVNKTGPKFTDTDKFINMLYYADVTISIGSTLSIDAAAFDKPAIAINYDDPEKHLGYWESVHRFNDSFDHQIHLIHTGGVRTPTTADDVVNDINEYMRDNSLDHDGRKKVLEEFVEPFDGKAGERLGKILANEINT